MEQLTTQDIADRLGGDLVGCGTLGITGVETLDSAGPEQITFIRDETHAGRWARSAAGAAVVSRELELQPGSADRALIAVDDADLAMAKLLALFAPPAVQPTTGIDAGARIDPSANVADDCAIAAGCVVGRNVTIGPGCVLHENVVIKDACVIGEQCELMAGVVIRERCRLGRRVVCQPGVVIGADGFGYRPTGEGAAMRLVRMPHIGAVRIDDDVELGAGTCVDRGKFSDTVIGAGTKIDNLCQIAHNVVIGRSCVIAGQTGIAGSAVVGDGVQLGGQVAIRDHVTIGSGAKLAACAAVMDDVPEGATWGGYPARDVRIALREHAAMRKLPELTRLLRKS
jgi:UDP-3-O-[3-hydroxymyristoyl] glucosamine N-acyltransferase